MSRCRLCDSKMVSKNVLSTFCKLETSRCRGRCTVPVGGPQGRVLPSPPCSRIDVVETLFEVRNLDCNNALQWGGCSPNLETQAGGILSNALRLHLLCKKHVLVEDDMKATLKSFMIECACLFTPPKKWT